MDEDIMLEVARIMRECAEAVEKKIRDQQTGEIWKDLPQVVDLRPLVMHG